MQALETRKIDELGRIVLPQQFRETYGWGEKAGVAIYQDNDTLILKLSDGSEETV